MFKNLDPLALGVAGHQSEIIELALTFGFRGMDLNIVEFAGRMKVHGARYARRLIDSARIRVGTFPLPLDWDVDDDAFRGELEKLPEYAQIASELGCTRCICTIAPAGDKRPYHENFEFHKRRFAEICRVLEPAGVRLGVGFRAVEGLRRGQAFQFIHDLDALFLLLNMVGSANIGLSINVWDLWLSGGSVENLRSLSPQQIVALQLADLPADIPPADLTDEHRLVPGATGKIDCAAVLIALAQLGYDGPVTVKADRSAFQSTRRDRIVRQVGEVLDRLWKAAGLTSEGKLVATAGKALQDNLARLIVVLAPGREAGMATHPWVEDFPGAITVCDRAGIILEMNQRAAVSFASYGGRELIGSNLLDCHPEPARTKLKDLLASGATNVYSVEKDGVRKLIYQAPWYDRGERAGLVEIAVEVPFSIPHFLRQDCTTP